MKKRQQRRKAEDFLALHHDPKLLVLPNVWDPLGARLLAGLGYPAVATASAAVAYSLGYADGQRIRFDVMLDVIHRIAESVEVPVTADIEAGYAASPEDVAENMRQVLAAGAVGINLEDSIIGEDKGEKKLFSIDAQCARIQAVRQMAEGEGVPLVINARTDVFVRNAGGSREANVAMAIERGQAYMEAGADCVYPIPVGDLALLREIHAAIQAPINVYASGAAASMQELEAAGISRLSLGPGFLKASLTTMKKIAQELQNYGSYAAFTDGILDNDEVQSYVSREKMGAGEKTP